jgi:phosphate ABC transporter phosphate-binding protein
MWNFELEAMVKQSRRSLFTAAWFTAACAATTSLLLLFLIQPSAFADVNGADSLSQVKTLYVETFTGGTAAAQLRDNLVHRLAKSSRFRLVQSSKDADALVEGTGQIWIRGYITTNSRAPQTNRQAVFGGYLSLEVMGANGQPLWSWLVTPGRFVWSSVVDDLAGHAAKKLLEVANSTTTPSLPRTGPIILAQTTLAGAGATFPAPLYQKWFQSFEQLHPGVTIHYSPIGSQLGVERILTGQLDFAGSDIAPAVIADNQAASHLHRIASVLGAVVPIYNVRGVNQDLRFAPETLANIYLGRIRRWNDPEIRRTNRGVDLPDADIEVIHRSDGSGTTAVWSDFLSKVSPAWASAVGHDTNLHWPVGNGAEHNEGVADAVQKTPNSIGYVELAYAIQHQLSFGAVRNHAGAFIHADLDSLAEAASGSGVADVTPTTITDPPGKNAYPIATFTWLLLPARASDPSKRAALIELFRWVLTSGQKECSALGYAPLPHEIAEAELRTLNGWQ